VLGDFMKVNIEEGKFECCGPDDSEWVELYIHCENDEEYQELFRKCRTLNGYHDTKFKWDYSDKAKRIGILLWHSKFGEMKPPQEVHFDCNFPNDFTYTITASQQSPMHPTEQKFPEQVKVFRDTIEKMYETHLKKNQDDSPANILVAGEMGVLIRIWDKFCRICNLMGTPFPAMEPKLTALVSLINKEPQMSKEKVVYELEKIIKECQFDFSKVKEKVPVNESIDDAYMDLAVYAVIGFITRQGKWGR